MFASGEEVGVKESGAYQTLFDALLSRESDVYRWSELVPADNGLAFAVDFDSGADDGNGDGDGNDRVVFYGAEVLHSSSSAEDDASPCSPCTPGFLTRFSSALDTEHESSRGQDGDDGNGFGAGTGTRAPAAEYSDAASSIAWYREHGNCAFPIPVRSASPSPSQSFPSSSGSTASLSPSSSRSSPSQPHHIPRYANTNTNNTYDAQPTLKTRTSSTLDGLDVYARGSLLGQAHQLNSRLLRLSCLERLARDFEFDPRTSFARGLEQGAGKGKGRSRSRVDLVDYEDVGGARTREIPQPPNLNEPQAKAGTTAPMPPSLAHLLGLDVDVDSVKPSSPDGDLEEDSPDRDSLRYSGWVSLEATDAPAHCAFTAFGLGFGGGGGAPCSYKESWSLHSSTRSATPARSVTPGPGPRRLRKPRPAKLDIRPEAPSAYHPPRLVPTLCASRSSPSKTSTGAREDPLEIKRAPSAPPASSRPPSHSHSGSYSRRPSSPNPSANPPLQSPSQSLGKKSPVTKMFSSLPRCHLRGASSDGSGSKGRGIGPWVVVEVEQGIVQRDV